MATRRTTRRSAEPPPPSIGNPFQQIPFQARDLQGIDTGGGPRKVFVPVDLAYREALAATLDAAAQDSQPELRAYAGALAPLVFKLRHAAIAKSHRPLKVVEEAGLLPAGHERVEQMIVGAHAGSMAALRSVIMERDILEIRANLSAIQRIERWGRAQRNPEGTLVLRQQGRALLRCFRYLQDTANSQLFHSLRALLSHLGIKSRFHREGRQNWFHVSLHELEHIAEDKLDVLLAFPGVRRLMPEPRFAAAATSSPEPVPSAAPRGAPSIGRPAAGLPTVAVFDTGVSPAATHLLPWIDGRDTYVLPVETDYQHGTHVASLVADAHGMNGGHLDFPSVGCLVHDVCGLEATPQGGFVTDLITRLDEALKKRPDVRVWNLSLGRHVCCDEQIFSDFGQALDRLSDLYNVLFVVAAGNYLAQPRRTWPPAGDTLQDRVSSPADSVRALTVGSVCHLWAPGSLNHAGEPAAYSRRGPGPVFTPKPDIVHAGGGVHAPWAAGPASVTVLTAQNAFGPSFGTSFSSPIAASMAAHAWQAVAGGTGIVPRPALVKALMVHAAQLSSQSYTPGERRYYGAGLPRDLIAGLYDRPDSFTLLFECRLMPSMRWRKAPYPIPAGLLRDGKFVGEVILTAVYAPPLDTNAGAEYVRANVELSFGTLDGDSMSGKVPMKGEDYSDGYEAAQVEHGGKWAPVKVHRKRFPQGVSGDTWALQAGMLLRALEPSMAEGLTVYILCTLRSLSGDPEIHAQGLRALQGANWVRQDLPTRVPIQAHV